MVFVQVPLAVMRTIAAAKGHTDAAIEASLGTSTPEFRKYVVQVNQLLQKDVIQENMCNQKIKGLWESALDEDVLASMFGQREKQFQDTSLVLVLQVVLNRVRCVAVASFQAAKEARDGADAWVFRDTPGVQHTSKVLNGFVKEGRVLEIPVVCSAASPNTARLLLAFVLAKEMSRRKGTGNKYSVAMMDCASIPMTKTSRHYPSEQLCRDLGFQRANVTFPASDHCGKDPDSKNCAYGLGKTATNKVFVLCRRPTEIAEWLLREFANLDTAEVLVKTCPANTGTRVPLCV